MNKRVHFLYLIYLVFLIQALPASDLESSHTDAEYKEFINAAREGNYHRVIEMLKKSIA